MHKNKIKDIFLYLFIEKTIDTFYNNIDFTLTINTVIITYI